MNTAEYKDRGKHTIFNIALIFCTALSIWMIASSPNPMIASVTVIVLWLIVGSIIHYMPWFFKKWQDETIIRDQQTENQEEKVRYKKETTIKLRTGCLDADAVVPLSQEEESNWLIIVSSLDDKDKL